MSGELVLNGDLQRIVRCVELPASANELSVNGRLNGHVTLRRAAAVTKGDIDLELTSVRVARIDTTTGSARRLPSRFLAVGRSTELSDGDGDQWVEDRIRLTGRGAYDGEHQRAEIDASLG